MISKIFKHILFYALAAIASFYEKNYQFALVKNTFPTLNEMAANLAVSNNALEVVKWEIYDYLLYPTAGIAALTFFQTGIGQGQSTSSGTAAGQSKFITDTNMTGAGVLPAPQAFWTEEIEVVTEPGSVATANTFTLVNPGNSVAAAAATVQAGAHDINAILVGGALQYNISQKPYYQTAPLYRAPPATRVQLDVAMASNSATATEVLKEKSYATGDVIHLNPGVAIMTAQNFNVAITYPVIIATPSGFNARIGVILSGWLFRGVQ